MKFFKLAAEQGYSDAKLIIAAENGDKNAAFRLCGNFVSFMDGGGFGKNRASINLDKRRV